MRLFKTLKTALYITLGVLALEYIVGCKPKDDDPVIPVGPVAMATVLPDRSAYANDNSSLVSVDATASSSGVPLESFIFNAYDSSSNLIDSYTETTTSAPDGTFDGFTQRNYEPGTISVDIIVRDEWDRTDTTTVYDRKRGYGVIDGTAGETGRRADLQSHLGQVTTDLSYLDYQNNGGAGWNPIVGSGTVYAVAWGNASTGEDIFFVPNWENLTTQQQDDINATNYSVIVEGTPAAIFYAMNGTETPQEIEARLQDFHNAGTPTEKLEKLVPQ